MDTVGSAPTASTLAGLKQLLSSMLLWVYLALLAVLSYDVSCVFHPMAVEAETLINSAYSQLILAVGELS